MSLQPAATSASLRCSPLAALLSGHVPGVAGKRVGVTLSGGNVGAARFAELVGVQPAAAG